MLRRRLYLVEPPGFLHTLCGADLRALVARLTELRSLAAVVLRLLVVCLAASRRAAAGKGDGECENEAAAVKAWRLGFVYPSGTYLAGGLSMR